MLTEIDKIGLNPHQRAIVNHIHGGLLVMAPVGTGKTLVLAERAANAVKENPYHPNTAFTDWDQWLGNTVIATAILDQLLHHADIVAINGESYRIRRMDN